MRYLIQGKLHVLFIILAMVVFASTVRAQYLLEVGAPTWTTADAVPMGFINVANGNLHIEIPIIVSPQRGSRSFVAKMVYDSRIWKIVDNGTSQSWQPRNVYGTTPDVPTTPPGWRFLATDRTAVTLDAVLNQCTYQGNPYNWYQYQNYRFIDTSGTIRRFPLYKETTVPCHTAGTGTDTGPALDATGYWMRPNTNQPGAQEVLAPDGTKEYFLGIPYGDPIPWKDANGNYMHRSIWDGWVTYDTLNRAVMQITLVGNNEFDYTVQTSSGSSTYKVFFNYLATVNTNFGVSGVTEYNGGWYTLNKIELPDGSSYEFTYEGTPNGHGLLKSMTLPTGQTVQFTHSNFTDAQGNRNRWANTITTLGGTTTYTAATCGSNCNKVTVTPPNANDTVYEFALNTAGAWNTQTKSYTGTAASGTLMLTVASEYDTNLGNPVTGGIGFVRPIRATTTIPGPSGNLVSKTEATFDTFTYSYRGTNYTGSRGNLLTQSEYAYGSGAAGGLVRQRVLSYLHDSDSNYIAKNIVKRITNAQTKDASGTKITETIISYDSATPTLVSGITHHDDTNYGTGYIYRGNLTETKVWTGSGNSTVCSNLNYLCSTLTYDTTGQVLSSVDPKGNTVSFSYANSFYLDNGANPPAAYTPAPPATNAYVTQMTQPILGTTSAGYYYGSGSVALSTDINNRTTYLHYQDPLNRFTRVNYPAGGYRTTAYDSSVQTTFTTALFGSTTKQTQLTLNPATNTATGSLLTDPSGTTYADSVLDTSGRLQSITNPFRSGDTVYSKSVEYDGLDRATKTTLQDNNYRETFYGATVGSGGGITSQLCATGTYGIGYPVLHKDEAGKKRQAWTDALGRLIETDEPDSSGALTLGTCYKYTILGQLVQGTRVSRREPRRMMLWDG